MEIKIPCVQCLSCGKASNEPFQTQMDGLTLNNTPTICTKDSLNLTKFLGFSNSTFGKMFPFAHPKHVTIEPEYNNIV